MTIYPIGWKLRMNGSGNEQANLRINQFFQKSIATPPDAIPSLLFLAEPIGTCDFRDDFIGFAVFSAFVDSTWSV